MDRTKQIEMLDPREDLAQRVFHEWFRFNTDRQAWLSRGLEARRYVTAPDTSVTEVGTLGWKNRTTIPKLTQLVDGLQSYYMAALMPNDQWFIWEGRDEESQQKANLIEEYMRTKVRMSNFRTEMEKIIRDWVIYGNCFGTVSWVEEFTTSPVSGEKIVNYVGPKLQRISPVDAVLDPRATSFDSSPLMIRSIVGIGDLLKHNETVVAPKFDEAALKQIVERRSGGPLRNDFVDFYKENGLEIDGFESIDAYLDSSYVELITYYGDIYIIKTGELQQNRIITIADGAWVLRNEENPSWNGKKPCAFAPWRILPDNIYGQSPIDNLVGMQYRVDHLENLKADVFDQIAHPVVIQYGDSDEDFTWGPGAKHHLPIDGKIDILRPDATALNADNQIALYHNYMEQMAGVPREAMGHRTPGEKTAFEMSVLQQGADRQFIDKINHFEEMFVERILNLFFEMTIRNMDVVDVARTFNDDTGALAITEITKEDVVADGVLRPIGAKHFEARNKRVQELRTLLELAANSAIGTHISGLKAAQMLSEELGWDKYNVVQPFAAITEAAQAQVQQEIVQQQLGEAGVESGVEEE